jgi:hypothetical protein
LTKILLGIFIKEWDTTMGIVIKNKSPAHSSRLKQIGVNYDTKPSLDIQCPRRKGQYSGRS